LDWLLVVMQTSIYPHLVAKLDLTVVLLDSYRERMSRRITQTQAWCFAIGFLTLTMLAISKSN
jgi:hypothetical protein